MDFDIATRRLQQDQRAAYAKARASQRSRNASASARRAAAASKLDAERRLLQKKLEGVKHDRIVDQIDRLVRRVERELGVMNVIASPLSAPSSTSIGMASTFASTDAIGHSANAQQQHHYQPQTQTQHSSSITSFETIHNNESSSFFEKGYTLSATSIHGAGDKITLPPSVLETLFASSSENSDNMDPWSGIGSKSGRPIAFRIGVRNADYIFPSSEKMKMLVEDMKRRVEAAITSNNIAPSVAMRESITKAILTKRNDDGDKMDDEEDMDEEDGNNLQFVEAYMDELSHRYLSYTHGTVVEFTEEEGHVGLPEPVAKALLQSNIHSLVNGEKLVDIPVKRTVDAALKHNDDSDGNRDRPTDAINANYTPVTEGENNEDKTPGHPAYGLFDIPALPIEIIPIHNLPPGKQCTFTPTLSSIQHGFYDLKDIKLVLEQSLIRTRATLSRGDVIRTWRRGVSYDLIVSSLEPGKFGVVSCVNTDINVDIGPPDVEDGIVGGGDDNNAKNLSGNMRINPLGGGRLLSEDVPSPMPQNKKTNIELILPPEPGEDVKIGVCVIQIHGRTSSGSVVTGRRRFLIGSTLVKELFAFASQSCCDGADPMTFRLVTRFPRRVFALSSSSSSSKLDGIGGDGERVDEGFFDGDMTLEKAGIRQGQEMFMVELI